MHDFEAGRLDILVGTQTITKGYHFPGVTLVGILWADINLSIPMYNAAEVRLQQLIQVAGRAGRQSNNSHVIVQTMINHPIFQHLNEQDYTTFYAHEIKNRTQVQYPPCNRLAEIECRNENESIVEKEAQQAVDALKKISHKYPQIIVLGPSKSPVSKVKNIHSRKIYI